jgi:uncharacterized protein YodC (DUF2158 family)
MKYKEGSVVMKMSGGNKMTVDAIYISDDIYYKCFWFDDKKLHNQIFKESQIVSLNEYRNILKIEERNSKIKDIINGF